MGATGGANIGATGATGAAIGVGSMGITGAMGATVGMTGAAAIGGITGTGIGGTSLFTRGIGNAGSCATVRAQIIQMIDPWYTVR